MVSIYESIWTIARHGRFALARWPRRDRVDGVVAEKQKKYGMRGFELAYANVRYGVVA